MKIKVSELKKYLKDYNQKELIQLIVEMSKINKEVQSYLSSKFLGEEAVEELFVEAKGKIENEFFPSRGDAKLRLAEVKKIITAFEKLTSDKMRTADLMLFYVEQALDFSCSYAYMDDNFLNSIARMFEKVISICDDEQEIYLALAERLEKIIDSNDNFVWGFQDYLCDTYYSLQWLEDDEED